MSILTPNRFNNMNSIRFDINNNPIHNINKQYGDSKVINHKKRLTHSNTFDNIFRKQTNWPKDINEYDYNKKHLQWGKNPPVNYITKEYISSAETSFNPITQKYTNKTFEEQLKEQEKKKYHKSYSKGI